MAALIPGIMVVSLLSITAYIVDPRVKKVELIKNELSQTTFSWRLRGQLFLRAAPAILLPFIILGSIYAGAMTPTETGALGAVLALLIGIFVYKEMRYKQFSRAIVSALRITTMIYLLIGMAFVFGFVLIYMYVPQTLVELVTAANVSPTMLLILTIILGMILGCFLDAAPIAAVMVPIVIPLFQQVGIDCIYFGAIFCEVLLIGQITPPFGLSLFTMSGVTKESYMKVTKGCLYFYPAHVISLVILVAFPQVVMFLPELLGYIPS